VLVEIVNDDGTMKRAQQLREFADEHGLVMISIEDLVRYRHRNEVLVERVAVTSLPTEHGDFTAYGYRIAYDPPSTWRSCTATSPARSPCSPGCTRNA